MSKTLSNSLPKFNFVPKIIFVAIFVSLFLSVFAVAPSHQGISAIPQSPDDIDADRLATFEGGGRLTSVEARTPTFFQRLVSSVTNIEFRVALAETIYYPGDSVRGGQAIAMSTTCTGDVYSIIDVYAPTGALVNFGDPQEKRLMAMCTSECVVIGIPQGYAFQRTFRYDIPSTERRFGTWIVQDYLWCRGQFQGQGPTVVSNVETTAFELVDLNTVPQDVSGNPSCSEEPLGDFYCDANGKPVTDFRRTDCKIVTLSTGDVCGSSETCSLGECIDLARISGADSCGNGICGPSESIGSCPADCQAVSTSIITATTTTTLGPSVSGVDDNGIDDDARTTGRTVVLIVLAIIVGIIAIRLGIFKVIRRLAKL